MLWVRIRLGGREYLGVLDTGATISIVAKKILPCGSLKNTMTTAAIRLAHANCTLFCAPNAQKRTGSQQGKKTICLDVS